MVSVKQGQASLSHWVMQESDETNMHTQGVGITVRGQGIGTVTTHAALTSFPFHHPRCPEKGELLNHGAVDLFISLSK